MLCLHFQSPFRSDSMKRLLTSWCIISSLILSPALRADNPESDDEEGTPVGEAAHEGANAAKKKRLQNIALATGAVAVAVTALILVANNDGHHHHKHKK
jgi:hypothetical protein